MVTGGGESMGMDEIRFNYAVKKVLRLKITTLPFVGWTKNEEPKKKTRKECLFCLFCVLILARSSHFLKNSHLISSIRIQQSFPN